MDINNIFRIDWILQLSNEAVLAGGVLMMEQLLTARWYLQRHGPPSDMDQEFTKMLKSPHLS